MGTGNAAKKTAKRAAKINLDTKQQPVQQRSVETFELILDVTAQLLGDVGVERLSTNMVCEKAGISPPALYRYFPNKYAILKELGARLMALSEKWFGMDASKPPKAEAGQ